MKDIKSRNSNVWEKKSRSVSPIKKIDKTNLGNSSVFMDREVSLNYSGMEEETLLGLKDSRYIPEKYLPMRAVVAKRNSEKKIKKILRRPPIKRNKKNHPKKIRSKVVFEQEKPLKTKFQNDDVNDISQK